MPAPDHFLLRYLRRLGAGSLLVSIIIHAVLVIIATICVVSGAQTKRTARFQGGSAGPSGPPAISHQVRMSRQQPTLATLNKRLSVDVPNADVTLPDLPDLPGVTGAGPVSGSGRGSGPGNAAGIGAGAGLGRGPVMPVFGFREAVPGGSLRGYLYDLKQNRDRHPNPVLQKLLATMQGIAPYDELMKKELGGFIQSNWNPTYLTSKFYRSPTALYTTRIFVPDTPADEAPKAYSAEKTVQPKCWIAHYRGRVSPPVTGTYRFVGGADDVMIVRIDGRLVLDAGIAAVSNFKTDRPQKPNYQYDFKPANAMGVPYLNQRRGGFVVGSRMELRAGLFYDLDIVIGESPGGFFFANLLIEQEGVSYEKDGKGNPILPVFRVADTPPPAGDLRMPPHQKAGPVWRVLPLSAN